MKLPVALVGSYLLNNLMSHHVWPDFRLRRCYRQLKPDLLCVAFLVVKLLRWRAAISRPGKRWAVPILFESVTDG